MPGECLRDVALGQCCWLRDGFDLGRLRRRSSTPAVVPGAAPALAKVGVGGYIERERDYVIPVLLPKWER